MIERLQDVLPYLQRLPPEAQEEAAMYIEALAEAFNQEVSIHNRSSFGKMQQVDHWEDPAGAWSDLPDTLLEDLEQLRHAVPQTPPLDLI